MKSIFKIISGLAAGVVLACAGGEGAITAERAQALAVDVLGQGEAEEAERETLDGQPAWAVHVTMSNGADVEVVLHAESEDVLELEAKSGPFDYGDFTPAEDVLSYHTIRAVALDEVAGTVEAWEFKRESADPTDDAEYEYEFYVRAGDGELWEIKFHADDGEVTHLEVKGQVDP